MKMGACATYDVDQSLYAVGNCRVFYHKKSAYNFTSSGSEFLVLPVHISELSQYMCGPLNRKGLLCSECADGFGPSVTTYGNRCAKCTNFYDGLLLFLLIELVPITVLYVLILVFQVRVTTPPLPSFIMFSQLVVYIIEHQIIDSNVSINDDGELVLSFKIMRILYGIFNLDFFYFIFPPLCVSYKVMFIHIAFIRYLFSFYPLMLILLTYTCVKMHGKNVKFIVFLWKPFHRLFTCVRRRWNKESDLVDVFNTFFILSYSKSFHLVAPILQNTKLSTSNLSNPQHSTVSRFVVSVDPSIVFFSKHHLPFAVTSVALLIIFNIVPPLLLLLYPTRAFKSCLSWSRVNVVALNNFMDKFQSFYRDGLDGGRDMRCFSAFYFYLLTSCHLLSLIVHHAFKLHHWTSIGTIILIAVFILSVARPYKKKFMNNYYIDILLLLFAVFLSFSHFNSVQLVILVFTSPVIIVATFLSISKLSTLFRHYVYKLKHMLLKAAKYRFTHDYKPCSTTDASIERQILVPSHPTITELSYGTINI